MTDIVQWLDERAKAVSNMQSPRTDNSYGKAAAEIVRLRKVEEGHNAFVKAQELDSLYVVKKITDLQNEIERLQVEIKSLHGET